VWAVAGRALDALAVALASLVGVAGRAGLVGAARAAMRLVAARALGVAGRGGLGLRGVAGRARRRRPGLVRPGGVTAGARVVAGADELGIGGVAGRAGRRRLARLVCRRGVALRAGGVAAAGRRAGLAGVALAAQRRFQLRLAGVRRVAVEAPRGRMMRLVVARRARDGELARGEGVRRVAAIAGRRGATLGRRWMADRLGVTAGARPGRGAVVLGVAAGAARVLVGDERVLLGVAAGARHRLGLVELVRRVAAGAGGVAGGDRAIVDLDLALLLGVAGRAAPVGDRVGLVHLVAVEAAARAGVMVGLAGVAARARPGIEGRRAVWAVAVEAVLVGVGADRRMAALRLCVAAHAVGRGDVALGAEAVAVLAPGRLHFVQRIGRVQRRTERSVALAAHLRRRRREPGVAVAVAARHAALDHVRGVAGAVAHVVPGHRDLLRRGRALGAGAGNQPHGERGAGQRDRVCDERGEPGNGDALHRDPTG